MADEARKIFAVLFHPEVNHTEAGANSWRSLCMACVVWREIGTPTNIVDESVAKIRAQVGNRPVICGLSGGVDQQRGGGVGA